MLNRLNEDTALKFKTLSPEEKSKRGILGRLYGPVASFSSPTRNGRRYTEALWEKLFGSDLIKEKFANGGIFGELCHPDYEDVNMEKIACIMPEPPVKDKNGQLEAYVDILDTPCGRIAYQLAKYGYKFGISSRGSGDLISGSDGEEEVDPDTYQLNAFDLVEVPAVETARLAFVEGLENKKRYNKTLKQTLRESLDKASESDRKIMEEALGNLNINIDEDAYTRDELMDKFGTDDLDLINAGNEEDVTLADDVPPVDMGSDLVPNDIETMTDPQPTETESLDEKLVPVPEEEQQAFEDTIKEMGWEIEGKGRTLFDSIHYQLAMEFDHDVTREDARPVVVAMRHLSEKMRNSDVPMTYNIGLHKRGNNILSCGLDLHKKYVEEELGEAIPTGEKDQRELMGKLTRIRNLADRLLSYDSQFDFNTEEDEVVKADLEGALDSLQKLCSEMSAPAEEAPVEEELEFHSEDADYYQGQLAQIHDDVETLLHEIDQDPELKDSITYKNLMKIYDILDDQGQLMNEAEEEFGPKKFASIDEAKEYISSLPEGSDISIDCNNDGTEWYINEGFTNESCDDKELEECGSVDNVMEETGNELTEALLKVKQLEKDNLSLQEKLSVCNAKEVQLGEELKRYKASTASLSESAKKAKALDESVKSYTEELDKKDKLIESLKNDASLVIELNEKVQKLEEELNLKSVNVSELNETLDRYRSSLKSTRELYLEALVNAYGLDINEVRSKLTESYKNKDIKKVCDSLLQEKRNLSKLPFKLNESGVKLTAKSNKKDARPSFFDDDNTESLLNLINNIK